MEPNDTPAPAGTVSDAVVADTPRANIDALADILDDPAELDNDGDEAHADDAEGSDAEASAEDSDEKAEGDKQDEPEATGGRFVEHTARVKLPDGTTTTVAELTQGYFRQSDYTRKSQENAQIRQAVETERQWVGQTAQQLLAQQARLAAMLDQWKPRRPETSPTEDPMGWLQYQQQKEAWEQWQGTLDNEGQNLYVQQAQVHQAGLAQEAQALFQKFPAMSDPAKRQTFFEEACRTFGRKYGFSPEEIGSIGDHRFIIAIRDLMRADRLSAKAPEVKQQVNDRPRMVRGGRRGGDPARDAKRARIERLSETGSRADGVRALMDLDL